MDESDLFPSVLVGWIDPSSISLPAHPAEIIATMVDNYFLIRAVRCSG